MASIHPLRRHHGFQSHDRLVTPPVRDRAVHPDPRDRVRWSGSPSPCSPWYIPLASPGPDSSSSPVCPSGLPRFRAWAVTRSSMRSRIPRPDVHAGVVERVRAKIVAPRRTSRRIARRRSARSETHHPLWGERRQRSKSDGMARGPAVRAGVSLLRVGLKEAAAGWVTDANFICKECGGAARQKLMN